MKPKRFQKSFKIGVAFKKAKKQSSIAQKGRAKKNSRRKNSKFLRLLKEKEKKTKFFKKIENQNNKKSRSMFEKSWLEETQRTKKRF